MVHINKPYDRTRVITTIEGESATDTSFGNDTNINNIVERFKRTGSLPESNQTPQYCDVTGLQEDLTTIIAKGKEAQAELQQLHQEQLNAKQRKILENEEKLKKYEKMEQERLQAEQTPPEAPT